MQTYRQQHLFRLWRSYLNESPLPQADRWLAAQFKINKQFGKKDRQFYADLFFAGLRHALFALYGLEIAAQRIAPQADLTDWLTQYQHPQALWQKIKASNPETFFNWILARINQDNIKQLEPAFFKTYQAVATRLDTAEPAAKFIWHSLPPAFLPHVQQRSLRHWDSAQLNQFFIMQDSKPPLWLRLKHSTNLDAVVADLAGHQLKVLANIKLQQTDALAVAGDKGIYVLDCYKNGAIEIQDLASQMIGDVIRCETPKPMVLDACAGGGGKTMQIAANLHNTGAIYALDIRDYKLQEIKHRAKKGGFHNIRTSSWDWSRADLPAFPKEVRNAGGFDWILVDAPCSSAGTWRRNPDAKWRFDLQQLPDLNKLQAAILRQTAQLLKPGGYLAYATCSFLCAENEAIVEAFLAEHPQYKLVQMRLLGAPECNSDTMFVAVLQKLA